MILNIGDIFQFPNGKYQWKISHYVVDFVFKRYVLLKYFNGISLNQSVILYVDNPFLMREIKNMITILENGFYDKKISTE